MKRAIKEAKRVLAIKGFEAINEQELKRAYWRIVKDLHTCNGYAIADTLEYNGLVQPLSKPYRLEIDNVRTFAIDTLEPNPSFIILGPYPNRKVTPSWYYY